MITVSNVSLNFSDKKLFEDINVKFLPGNCYGVIGANGAGKSTFLKILSGEIDSNKGNVYIEPGQRMAVLKQNHYEFDDYTVLDTVIMGHKRLYEIMKAKEELYSKEEFTDEDGILAGDLEAEFAELNGWDAEYNANKLLSNLGVDKDYCNSKMSELSGKDKVKVLLAQSLFGNPDIILMDEPTNHLDFKVINWLEDFLIDYDKTVIVVSHDRHFLNKVCTHMLDIDFNTAKLYPGNYDFWYQSSQLALQLAKESNKKKEQKIKELEDFIARFSANASKSKQATSRKKSLEKIELEEIRPSSRKYPYIGFTLNRDLGKDILTVEGITKTIEGKKVLDNVSFTLNRGDKAVLLGHDDVAKTTLLKILAGEMKPDKGTFKFGQTVEFDYFPLDNSAYFEGSHLNLIEWLAQYSKDTSEIFLRGFLGRMLFSGEQPLKMVSVLSGGEKVRCMFSKLMLSGANLLMLDQPTNHLDLESIQAVNDGLVAYKGCLLFTSHDHSFIDTVANKVIEITDNGAFSIDMSFSDYLADEKIQSKIEVMYGKKN
ncbi:MAG: ATP-binding cassette domain-containing protein [Bacilli bacterium]|nr:ATP-binding cassette domain-containing protein [Bacilli bacterium]MDD4053889.1 ATP-binding cassette domain-containing protein [Bacilli bacterium]